MKAKRTALWACLLLLCLALVLGGCREETPEITESIVWETVPPLDYGVLESEKLTAEHWYCGRAEPTSRCMMAETELGYYMVVNSFLYYADKANLHNWVVVCNQPDCKHSMNWSYGDVVCNGSGISRFLFRDGRIYYEEEMANYPELYAGKPRFGTMLASKAFDGTDIRMEFYLEDQLVGDMGGGVTATFTPSSWITAASILQPDGTYRNSTYRTTKDGSVLLFQSQTQEDAIAGIYWVTYGEEAFEIGTLDPTGQTLYRFRGEELEALRVGNDRGYLAGNTMRFFRRGHGYYDVDVTTGEEVFLAEPRMANSYGYVLLPNCILETSLFFSNTWAGISNAGARMEIFDGEIWREVSLPQELTTNPKAYANGFAVTSDCVFFLAHGLGENTRIEDKTSYRCVGTLYRIDLTQEEWSAELCQTLWRRES